MNEMIFMVKKKTDTKPTRKSRYNVLINMKTVVLGKAKAIKMKQDAIKRLKGSRVKIIKAGK